MGRTYLSYHFHEDPDRLICWVYCKMKYKTLLTIFRLSTPVLCPPCKKYRSPWRAFFLWGRTRQQPKPGGQFLARNVVENISTELWILKKYHLSNKKALNNNWSEPFDWPYLLPLAGLTDVEVPLWSCFAVAPWNPGPIVSLSAWMALMAIIVILENHHSTRCLYNLFQVPGAIFWVWGRFLSIDKTFCNSLLW